MGGAHVLLQIGSKEGRRSRKNRTFEVESVALRRLFGQHSTIDVKPAAKKRGTRTFTKAMKGWRERLGRTERDV